MGLAGQGGGVNFHDVLVFMQYHSIMKLINKAVDHVFYVGGQCAEAEERIGNAPVIMPLEQGQEFVADAVSGEAAVGIAGIVAEWLANIAEIFFHFAAADADKRAEERGVSQAPRAGHAGQAGDASAANNAVQNGFGLVVGCMGGEDEASANRPAVCLRNS